MIDDAHDPGVPEAGHQPRLGLEALIVLGADRLFEGDFGTGLDVLSAIHGSHRARGDRVDHAVATVQDQPEDLRGRPRLGGQVSGRALAR